MGDRNDWASSLITHGPCLQIPKVNLNRININQGKILRLRPSQSGQEPEGTKDGKSIRQTCKPGKSLKIDPLFPA